MLATCSARSIVVRRGVVDALAASMVSVAGRAAARSLSSLSSAAASAPTRAAVCSSSARHWSATSSCLSLQYSRRWISSGAQAHAAAPAAKGGKAPAAKGKEAAPSESRGPKPNIRSIPIIPEFIGRKFEVHTGNKYVTVTVEPDMVGHKLGDFAYPRARNLYKKAKKLAAKRK